MHLKMFIETLKTLADGRRESHFKDRMSEGSGKGCWRHRDETDAKGRWLQENET